MTDRSLAIRLSVMDGGQVKATLEEIGESGQKSLQKLEVAANPASTALMALDAASANVRGRFEEMTGGLGPLGSALSQIGPVGLAAGAAFAIISETIGKSLEVTAEAEKSYNRLTAVLKATGESSGLTASDLVGLSKNLEATTLTTSEKVQDAAAIMATFRSVSGDTFTRAITLAQDLSAVFGKDLSASTMQLGKALEDPINGLTSLRRIGVVFTEGQRDLIKSLSETGDAAGAQKVILDALEAKIGGAGAAENQGLTGASHQLAISWKNMLETIGETSGIASVAEKALGLITNAAQVTTELLEKNPVNVEIGKTNQQLQAAQATLEKLQKLQPNYDGDLTPLIDKQKTAIADLQSQLKSLNDESKKQDTDKSNALKGAADAQRDARAEALEKLVGNLNTALDKTMTAPDEKIAKINEELTVTKQRIDALREKDGGNNPAIDAALKEADDVAQRQIEAIEKPINAAAEKANEANQKVITNFQEQLLALSDKRQAFIDQAVNRLSDQASVAQVAQTKKLAAQLFDQQAFGEAQKVIDGLNQSLEKLKDKRQAAIDTAVGQLPATATSDQIAKTKELAAALYDQSEAQKNLQKLQEEGKKITEETRTATESYALKIDELNKLLAAGTITQNVYDEALKKVNKESLASRTDAEAGAERAFQQYQTQAQDTASVVQKAFGEAMKGTDDALVGLITSSGNTLENLEKVANSIVTDITRMVVQQSITGPLFNAISGGISGSSGGSLFGDLFGSIFHEGGVVGDAAPSRRVPAYVFAGAPRYHNGGIAGLMPGEVPAILQRGETVLPKDGSRQSNPVNVIMNISTPDAGGFRSSQSQIAAEAARNIKRANRNL